MFATDSGRDRDGRATRPPEASVVDAAVVALSMLGDPTRLRLAICLAGGEQDVTTLTEAVGAARPAVSQHLAKMRLAGLVVMRRDGRRAVYALADQHVRRLVTESVYTAEHRVLDRPGHHARSLTAETGRSDRTGQVADS